jgi:C-terminal processing protease CtpA/Prc
MKTWRIAGIYLVAGLAGGFALSAMLGEDADPVTSARVPEAASLHSRIARLESQLGQVTAQTAALREMVERLDVHDRAQALSATQPAAEDNPRTAQARIDQESDAQPAPEIGDRFRRARGMSDRELAEQLSEAGFSVAEAQRIERRIEELRVEAMQSRYEAMRSDDPQSALDQLREATATLRQELGDTDYERYLEATGRPTRVGVTSVLASSAAELAGLQPGDQILAYGGQRVFDVRELNSVLLEGEPGEPVIVDVERDGQPIQLVIPRGPLGIAAGFRGRGGR